MTDYQKALQTLRDGQVRFIVIGGVAATAHGSTQLTNDLDVVYARSTDDIAHLAAALADKVTLDVLHDGDEPPSEARVGHEGEAILLLERPQDRCLYEIGSISRHLRQLARNSAQARQTLRHRLGKPRRG